MNIVDGTLLVGVGDGSDEHAFLAPPRAGGFVIAKAQMNPLAILRGRTEVRRHPPGRGR